MSNSEQPFSIQQEKNLTYLRLQPELNNVQWGEIDSLGTQAVQSLETHSKPNVIVDLSALNYMGSAMVALIVRVWKAAKEKNGRMSVVCPHEGVHEVLRLASLDNLWKIVETEGEARTALNVAPAPRVQSETATTGGGSAGWIVAALLLLVCIFLSAFAFNPGWFGLAVVPVETVEEPTDPLETNAPELGPAEESVELENVISGEEMKEEPSADGPAFPPLEPVDPSPSMDEGESSDPLEEATPETETKEESIVEP